MLQSGGVYPGVRAMEVLRHVASLHAHPLDVDALVERLGLGAAGRTPYRRLSGGQQQLLSLAMAVVGRPELVFLDEPTAGLDPQARRATWELVGDLKADGVTVVLTTHYMEEAEKLADAVVVVDHGRVIAAGSPRELTTRGAGGTVRFSAPAGLDIATLAAELPSGTEVRETIPGHYLVTGTVDPQLLASVTAWCAARRRHAGGPGDRPAHPRRRVHRPDRSRAADMTERLSLRARTRRRLAGAHGPVASGARAADDPAQRRAAPAHRRDPGPGADRVLQHRGDGSRDAAGAHRLPRARGARAGRAVDRFHGSGDRHGVRAALRRAEAARRHSPAPLGAAGEQGAGGAGRRGAADGADLRGGLRARAGARRGRSPPSRS